MLAFLDNSTWVRWTDQTRPLNGKRSYQLPPHAEEVYSVEELAAYGLHRVIPATVPEGKRVVSSSIVDQTGTPVEMVTLEDAPPPPPPPRDLLAEIDALKARTAALEARAAR